MKVAFEYFYANPTDSDLVFLHSNHHSSCASCVRAFQTFYISRKYSETHSVFPWVAYTNDRMAELHYK